MDMRGSWVVVLLCSVCDGLYIRLNCLPASFLFIIERKKYRELVASSSNFPLFNYVEKITLRYYVQRTFIQSGTLKEVLVCRAKKRVQSRRKIATRNEP